MYVLRQNDECIDRRIVAAAGQHRGRRLVARGLDSQHPHDFQDFAPDAAPVAVAGVAGMRCTFTCDGLTRKPSRVVSMSTRCGRESFAGIATRTVTAYCKLRTR